MRTDRICRAAGLRVTVTLETLDGPTHSRLSNPDVLKAVMDLLQDRTAATLELAVATLDGMVDQGGPPGGEGPPTGAGSLGESQGAAATGSNSEPLGGGTATQFEHPSTPLSSGPPEATDVLDALHASLKAAGAFQPPPATETPAGTVDLEEGPPRSFVETNRTGRWQSSPAATFTVDDPDRSSKAAALTALRLHLERFGHGHVIPRADGIRTRCGGPGICQVCSRDQAEYDRLALSILPPPPAALDHELAVYCGNCGTVFGYTTATDLLVLPRDIHRYVHPFTREHVNILSDPACPRCHELRAFRRVGNGWKG